jgi:hypothetical protein
MVKLFCDGPLIPVLIHVKAAVYVYREVVGNLLSHAGIQALLHVETKST